MRGLRDRNTRWNCRPKAAAGVFILSLLFVLHQKTLAQESVLQLDPSHTSVKFTLGDVLHTVRGTFPLKRGGLKLDVAAGKISGEIVVDAKGGESGNSTRDRKMHREILESDKYPEIVFRPNRVEGTIVPSGKSSVQVHGTFSIHGADHEMIAPADVEFTADHWSAVVHFPVPYVKWGLKNPSNFFLHVDDTVQIDLEASGSITKPAAPPAQ